LAQKGCASLFIMEAQSGFKTMVEFDVLGNRPVEPPRLQV